MDKYFLVTIFRLGKYENIFVNFTFSGYKNELDINLCNFVLVEKELGRETCIINTLEISQIQYQKGLK